MDISVREIRLIPRGNLKAFVDMELGELTIRDFRIIQADGHRAYLAAPQVRINTNGEVEYKTLITMPKHLKQQAESIALAAFYEMAKGEGNERQDSESL